MALKYLFALSTVLLAVFSFPVVRGAPSMDDDIQVKLNVTDETQNSNDSCTQYMDDESCCAADIKCSFCFRDMADKKECSAEPCEENRLDHCAPKQNEEDVSLTTVGVNIDASNDTTTPSPSSNDTTTQAPNTTTVPVTTTTDANSTTPNATTITPNVTTTVPEPTSTTPANESTTVSPTSVAPTNSTPIETTTTTAVPVPSNTTGSSVNTTTPGKSPSGGDDDGQRFDGASFIGGIVLCGGLMALAFFGMKFYKGRKEQNYHTL